MYQQSVGNAIGEFPERVLSLDNRKQPTQTIQNLLKVKHRQERWMVSIIGYTANVAIFFLYLKFSIMFLISH